MSIYVLGIVLCTALPVTVKCSCLECINTCSCAVLETELKQGLLPLHFLCLYFPFKNLFKLAIL